ncbi:hypothetical protein SESBI_15205 [Sesbania bispinosa]|nr:hypothetical protein SESBI_15205 [Sesbania bispinosa]
MTSRTSTTLSRQLPSEPITTDTERKTCNQKEEIESKKGCKDCLLGRSSSPARFLHPSAIITHHLRSKEEHKESERENREKGCPLRRSSPQSFATATSSSIRFLHPSAVKTHHHLIPLVIMNPVEVVRGCSSTRLDSLKYVLNVGLFEVDSDMTDGLANDFLRDIVELSKRYNTRILSNGKR